MQGLSSQRRRSRSTRHTPLEAALGQSLSSTPTTLLTSDEQLASGSTHLQNGMHAPPAALMQSSQSMHSDAPARPPPASAGAPPAPRPHVASSNAPAKRSSGGMSCMPGLASPARRRSAAAEDQEVCCTLNTPPDMRVPGHAHVLLVAIAEMTAAMPLLLCSRECTLHRRHVHCATSATGCLRH